MVLENVGPDERSSELFRELVPSTQYRAQVLYHCAVLCINNVIFVISTGGSMVEGSILYACVIEFSESLRHSYTYYLDCVRLLTFEWIGMDGTHVPKEYDTMLRSSHHDCSSTLCRILIQNCKCQRHDASDIYSFVSYYNLSKDIRREVIQRGSPIPPCRMIRLTAAVFWNNLKGGVDVFTDTLKLEHVQTLARTL